MNQVSVRESALAWLNHLGGQALVRGITSAVTRKEASSGLSRTPSPEHTYLVLRVPVEVAETMRRRAASLREFTSVLADDDRNVDDLEAASLLAEDLLIQFVEDVTGVRNA